MSDYYIKQDFMDDDGLTTYYVHYHNEYPIRQLEINGGHRFKMTKDNPAVYDPENIYFPKRELSTSPICLGDMDPADFITESEFDEVWNK